MVDLPTRLNEAASLIHTYRRDYNKDPTKNRDRNEPRPMPSSVLAQIPTVGIAVTIIEYFPPESINALVQLRIAHPSTLQGGTLSIARKIYDHFRRREQDSYDKGQGKGVHNYILDGVTDDNLEQLQRVCQTAGSILEHRLF